MQSELLHKLFISPHNGSLAKPEDVTKILAIAEIFARTAKVTTSADLETLMPEFQTSKIPDGTMDFASYLNYLNDHVIPHSINTASPRFIGHMTSALPRFVSSIGMLITAMNQNVVKVETSKAMTLLERQALAMMHRLVYNLSDDFYAEHIQHSESTLGMMVTGGTLANIAALWCARNSSLGPQPGFAGIEKEGLPAALDFYGYKGAVIIGSQLMQYSLRKAADLLGIGVNSLIDVAVDKHNRMDLRALRQTLDNCRARGQLVIALVGVAGTTDAGSIDPLSEMAEMACEANVHFHVDAAWGGPVLFSETHRHKLAGIEQADSVTIDGHKQLYLPMGMGMMLLRDPLSAKEIEKTAYYVVRPNSFDLGKRTIEGSRPNTSLMYHAALSIIGRRGYEFLIDEGIRKARYMAAVVDERPEFELLAEPQINIVNYRFVPAYLKNRSDEAADNLLNDLNKRLQKAQRQAGDSFVSRTTIHLLRNGVERPITALRAVLANPLTTEADIDAVLEEQIRLATNHTDSLTRSHSS